MTEAIRTVTLSQVEIQENGIIRNEAGYLIGRLVDRVEFDSKHIQKPEKILEEAVVLQTAEPAPEDNPTEHRRRFAAELRNIINRYGIENGSDTPDLILAEYLAGCLDVFDAAVNTREKWYGRNKENEAWTTS